jgi:hypothetical protein
MRFFERLKTAAFKSVIFTVFFAFFEKNKMVALSASRADKVATPFLWFVFRIVFPCPDTQKFPACIDRASTLYPTRKMNSYLRTQFDRERGRSFPGKVQAWMPKPA